MGGHGRGKGSRVAKEKDLYMTSVGTCIAYLWCLGMLSTGLISIA